MNSKEAKDVLLLYRPGVDDDDPDFAPAMELVRNDPDLKVWFDRHCSVQKAVLNGFEHITVPEGLKEQILSERKAHVGLGGKRKLVLVAAVAVALLLSGSLFYSNLGTTQNASLVMFRSRMARLASYAYPPMDLETNNLQEIRRYLASHDGQKDYVLPARLEKTVGTGCKILDWQGKKVSMLCFNSGKNGSPRTPDLFLFIVDRSAVRPPAPSDAPQPAKVSALSTVSWSAGDKTYLLAGSGDEKFLREYWQ